jgi:hypothetical protein
MKQGLEAEAEAEDEEQKAKRSKASKRSEVTSHWYFLMTAESLSKISQSQLSAILTLTGGRTDRHYLLPKCGQ